MNKDVELCQKRVNNIQPKLRKTLKFCNAGHVKFQRNLNKKTPNLYNLQFMNLNAKEGTDKV